MSRSIETIISRKLGFLKIEPEVISNFAQDYRGAYSSDGSLMQHITGRWTLDKKNFDRAAVRSALRRYEERLCTQFLLSTDFFVNGEDLSRAVSYVSFADPYLNPSYNSIAILDSGDAE